MEVEEVSDSLMSIDMKVKEASNSESNNVETEELPDSLEAMVENPTLIVNDYEISNLEFTVEFYFKKKDGLLSKVEINNEAKDGTEASFIILDKIMTKKYGKPTSTNSDRSPIGDFGELSKEKIWVFSTTTISLNFRSGFDSPDSEGTTTLKYTPTENEATDKI